MVKGIQSHPDKQLSFSRKTNNLKATKVDNTGIGTSPDGSAELYGSKTEKKDFKQLFKKGFKFTALGAAAGFLFCMLVGKSKEKSDENTES